MQKEIGGGAGKHVIIVILHIRFGTISPGKSGKIVLKY